MEPKVVTVEEFLEEFRTSLYPCVLGYPVGPEVRYQLTIAEPGGLRDYMSPDLVLMEWFAALDFIDEVEIISSARKNGR